MSPDILRMATPMGDWRSFKYTVGLSAGHSGTYTYKVQDTVGICLEDADFGAEAVLFYHAEKIMIRKKTGTGETFAVGQKVYYDPSDGLVTPNTVSGGLWIGIAVRTAGMTDTRVMIDLKGDKAT